MSEWDLTDVFWKNVEAAKTNRIVANKGGTSSSKTYSILQLLFTIASRSTKRLRISVVSETFPHLRKGAMSDFFDLIEASYMRTSHDKTNHTYHINKSKIEFFSADQTSKVKGPRRDILYVNEANHIPWKIMDQLMIRTQKNIFLDWNPESEYWFEEKLENREDCALIHSTYMDALNVVPKSIIREIEMRRPVYEDEEETILISGDPYWWDVYALGKTGTLEGLVYKHWKKVDAMPADKDGKAMHKWLVRAMDFGFTNDPSTLIDIAFQNGELWANQLMYEYGMINPEIAARMTALELQKRIPIYADSAEPKSIREIQRFGWNIRGAVKGPDSIKQGIQKVQQYPLNITKNSLEMIKELRNYKWLEKDGVYLNTPVDKWNHCLDPLRYGVTMRLGGLGGRTMASGST